MMLNTQIIEQNGKPAFAVIPYDEWMRINDILEDLKDRQAVADYLANPHQETIPAKVADQLLAGVNPIRVWRKHRRFSRQHLASLCGVTPEYLAQLERGLARSEPDITQRLATALGVETVELDVDPASP